MSEVVVQLQAFAVTREHAARSLGTSLDSFERYVQPEIKIIRLGKMRLVPTDELRRWVEANARSTLGDPS